MWENYDIVTSRVEEELEPTTRASDISKKVVMLDGKEMTGLKSVLGVAGRRGWDWGAVYERVNMTHFGCF